MQRNILIAGIALAVALAAGYALMQREPAPVQEEPLDTPDAAAPSGAGAQPQEAPAAAGAAAPETVSPDAVSEAADPAPDPDLPSLDIVRVAPGGEAVIAGGGPANARITLLLNGQGHARAIADDRGDWQLETVLPVGPAQLSLLARLVDGREAASAQSVVVDVPEGEVETPLVVLRQEGRPSRILQEPERPQAREPGGLALRVLDYSEDGGLILSGTGVAGAAVLFYLDNSLLGETRIGTDGAWTFRAAGDAVAPGLHLLRLDRLDADGNVADRIEEPFEQADPETIANLKPGEVIVQPGNSLWRISRRIYGKGIDYTVIYLANAEQIRDPDLIYPGQVFAIPQR